MQQENVVLYNSTEEFDEDFNINIEKLWKTIWSRKALLLKIFCSVLAFFILLTFIMPKKYKVTADLYINKSNSSNMLEVNPYVLSEASGSMVTMGADKAINNEIELMKSALVLDKVIKDNNIVFKKKYGFIPNKREGEYVPAKAFYGKGKILKIENEKNTNVIKVEYTSKSPKLAYGVVASLITNYIDLHKELNAEKSKSDKMIIEAEYAKIKEVLNKRLNQSSGIPVQAVSGVGNLSAMSAFSRSASQAMGNIKSQYVAGERSQIAVTEESQKLAQLATKLEWAKMVEQMSDASKVLVISEPILPRPFENSSPKLLINIIIGCILGYLAALSTLVFVEIKNDKLTYSMIGNNVIYDCEKNIDTIKAEIIGYKPKKVLLISLTQLQNSLLSDLQKIPNSELIYADITSEFVDKIASAENIMLISNIGVTSSVSYKQIKNVIKKQKKEILSDILV